MFAILVKGLQKLLRLFAQKWLSDVDTSLYLSDTTSENLDLLLVLIRGSSTVVGCII